MKKEEEAMARLEGALVKKEDDLEPLANASGERARANVGISGEAGIGRGGGRHWRSRLYVAARH